jgi:hypothetical protein
MTLSAEKYSRIPVFPLYANELHASEFSDGLKEDIDAYDYISSDLSDGITQIDGVYWAVKNYGGDNAEQLLQELQALKIAMTDTGADSSADAKVIEVPYQAKKAALDMLEKRMYSEYMALDIRALTGGSITNVAINVAKTDFDLKLDLFEYQVLDFMQSILALIGEPDAQPKFKRRSITNDTETVGNISTMLADGYADEEWAVKNNPLIADEEQDALLDRLGIARQIKAEADFPLGAADG